LSTGDSCVFVDALIGAHEAQGDPRPVVGLLRLDGHDAAEPPPVALRSAALPKDGELVSVPCAIDEQDRIALAKVRRSCEVESLERSERVEVDRLRRGLSRAEEVPTRASLEVCARLERLGALVWPRHALRPRSNGDCELMAIVEREGEVRVRRHSGPQLETDEPGELEHRTALGRRAQVALVRDPLLVEGEDVGDRGPCVEEAD
jgi:hypothetical protein